MEHQSRRFSAIGMLFLESNHEQNSINWHNSDQSVPREEVICPEPRHATGVPCVTDGLKRFSVKPIDSTYPVHKGDHRLNSLESFLGKDGNEEGDSDSSSQMGFFCGSPPVRTNNPVVRDAVFTKQTLSLASPMGSCHGINSPVKADRGSPCCGSPFAANLQGGVECFACGNSESPSRIVFSLA